MRIHYELKGLSTTGSVRGAHRHRVIQTAPRPVGVFIYI